MKSLVKPLIILFSALSIFYISPVAAQSVIVKGGVNIANVTITNDGDVDDNNSLTSFHAGLVVDIPIVSILSLQPGILFTGKGSKTQEGDQAGPTYYRATTNPWYIEIPANLVIKTPGSIRFFVGAGPYLGIGVAGKNKVDGKFLGTSFNNEKDIIWSNDDPSTLDYEEGAGYGIMKRFDYGLNGIAGIQLTKAVISAGYGLGLAKIQSGSNSSADDKNKHRVFSVSLGIKL
jgi:hypothetical protein